MLAAASVAAVFIAGFLVGALVERVFSDNTDYWW